MNLTDKVILITGGARVGQAVAARLHDAGAQLVMTYLDSSSEVPDYATGLQTDLTKDGAAHTVVQTTIDEFGTINGLVNMVSVFTPDGDSPSLSELQQQFAVNAFGNMLVSRAFAEHARSSKQSNAPIVSFIDWAVDHPYPNYDVYLAAKAALRHYVMALQTSFHTFVRVVNVHPGMILEPPDFPAAEKEAIMHHTPTGTIGSPEQAAQLVQTALELDFLADNIYLAGGQQWRHRLAPHRRSD